MNFLTQKVWSLFWAGLVGVAMYYLEQWTSWLSWTFSQIQSAVSAVAVPLVESSLAQYFPSVNWTVWLGYLGKINYFVPLSEGLVVVAGLVSLWIAVYFYRLVKSFIPTVSS